jgi:hypothetical protein
MLGIYTYQILAITWTSTWKYPPQCSQPRSWQSSCHSRIYKYWLSLTFGIYTFMFWNLRFTKFTVLVFSNSWLGFWCRRILQIKLPYCVRGFMAGSKTMRLELMSHVSPVSRFKVIRPQVTSWVFILSILGFWSVYSRLPIGISYFYTRLWCQ